MWYFLPKSKKAIGCSIWCQIAHSAGRRGGPYVPLSKTGHVAHPAGFRCAASANPKLEVIMVEAGKDREMTAAVEGAKARYRATLDELTAEFDRHLSELQGPDTHDRIEAALASRGRVIGHPKAGASF